MQTEILPLLVMVAATTVLSSAISPANCWYGAGPGMDDRVTVVSTSSCSESFAKKAACCKRPESQAASKRRCTSECNVHEDGAPLNQESTENPWHASTESHAVLQAAVELLIVNWMVVVAVV
jgi:hypothetical protein